MMRILSLALLLAAALFSGGCATGPAADPNHVSAIPWNRPEKWEGQAGLGGMIGTQ